MENIRNALEQRGILGDALLDALDLAEDIISVGGVVDDNGNAILYHATKFDNAKNIIDEQAMFGKEDGLFFSTKHNGMIVGYGEAVVKVTIPIEELTIDDIFKDEIHLKLAVKPFHKTKVRASLC